MPEVEGESKIWNSETTTTNQRVQLLVLYKSESTHE